MTPIFSLSSAHMFTGVWGRASNKSRPQAYQEHLDRLLTSEQWARGCETLTFNLATKPERSLLVTTPDSRTDTTTALVGLGLCMARLGRSVVLVEANFRHASFESIFGSGAVDERRDRAPAPGLADFIEGHATQSEIERTVEVELGDASASLRIVSSGRMSTHGFAPLTSPRLKPLFQSWKDSGSFVLVDSPPVLEVSDALLIAPRVDGALLVLSAGSIHEKDAKTAKARLEAAGTRVVGSVIWV